MSKIAKIKQEIVKHMQEYNIEVNTELLEQLELDDEGNVYVPFAYYGAGATYTPDWEIDNCENNLHAVVIWVSQS